MKKIIYLLVFIFAVSSLSYAQKTTFKPNLDATLRGSYSVWLSDASYKDYFKAFPSVQLDLSYNLSSKFAIYAAVGGDFIAPKERTFSIPGYTATESNSRVISAFAGPRIFFPQGTSKARFYADAGVGLYALKMGDYKETQTTNPPATLEYKYKSIAQIGFNLGAGVNVELSKAAFLNFNVKYHNVPKKSNVTIRETATLTTTVNGVTTTTSQTDKLQGDITGRSYIQFALGIGYRIGL